VTRSGLGQASWENAVPRETGTDRELHRFPDVWFSRLFSRMTSGLRGRLLSIGKYHVACPQFGGEPAEDLADLSRTTRILDCAIEQ
jgi:hypothetical protein